MNEREELYSFEDKPKRKRHEDPTTWADAFKAIGIFLGIMLIVGIVGNLLYYALMGDKMNTYYEILGTSNVSNPVLDNMSSFQSPLYMILSLILGMVFSVIALFIIYGLIHLFATKLFKGEGTLRGMIVRGNIWTTGTYLALSVAASIQSIILMNTIIDKFEGVNLGASYEAMQQYNEAILGVTIPILFIYGIAWLAWSFAMSRITARNYGLDFSKGCGSLFIMNVSLFVLLCGCSFALGMVVMSFFSTPY